MLSLILGEDPRRKPRHNLLTLIYLIFYKVGFFFINGLQPTHWLASLIF